VIRPAIAAVLALALAGCAGGAPATIAEPGPPQASAYTVTPDAMADVDAALARAKASGKRVLLVMGANWCHDSRALAGWLETPRFAALTAQAYEVVYVNVGVPQTGEGRNLEIAKRFGLEDLKGTPALLVLTPEGKAQNLDTAASWRNAASRSEDAIYAELEALSAPPAALRPETATKLMVSSDESGCRYALAADGPWVRDWTQLSSLVTGNSVLLGTDRNTDWKCVGKTIFELQQRFPTIGFVSDPRH